MTYPTDIAYLNTLTDDEWDALLATVWRAPTPRAVIRLCEPKTRRDVILERVAVGEKKGDIARSLGVSPGLISKIIAGVRS